MRPRLSLTACLLLATLVSTSARADDLPEQSFADLVRPFLKDHCVGCHGGSKPKGKLDLSGQTSTAQVARNLRLWNRVRERLDAGEMPPEDAPRQPSAHQRRAVIEWIAAFRQREARKNAGDPGLVLARRLSNAEYDNTIRDLTGVDIRPARDFPVDPANEAGFDNSGESLAMSPGLLEKYLAAARRVADHLVVRPSGFGFAPYPAVTETDRDRYCVERIVDFYRRHQVDYARYFLAAWRHARRRQLGQPEATLADFALEAGVSPRYMETVWAILTDPKPASGPLAELRRLWQKLPSDAGHESDARRGCQRMRDLVVRLRKPFEPRIGRIHVKGISDGSQPFVLWANRQRAAVRTKAEGSDDPDVAEFCRVFPDAFFVSERPPYFDPKGNLSGRLLTAGFHLMQGYFRDDAPLCELVLDESGRRELEELWGELNFVTLAPIRQYKDFVFFERGEPPRFLIDAEFDFARSEDKDVVSEEKFERLRTGYLAKARRIGASTQAIEAIEQYFKEMKAAIRLVERDHLAAEPKHLEELKTFSERAYRRPMTAHEKEELLAFYRGLREREGLSHEDALRDTVASVLISPRFCYRLEPAPAGSSAGPVDDHVLASRLSYFLWASMPDPELLAHASTGDLHQPAVLKAQAKRMLGDDRTRGLATEFAANWLDIRRFEEHNGVDRERFPSFSNALRHAMFEEPLRYFLEILRRDRSILEFLDGRDTFVNQALAKHYGIRVPAGLGPDEWVHVDDADPEGRGGLLPMAVFLTRNAPGLRTSPVKRGYWVVRRLLGEVIPPPPPEVPELPRDERTVGELTLPQVLARHRAHENCAGCHRRFDSIGLAFEGYGPIGERRVRDLGGRPVETRATYPDGSEGDGLDDLRRYLLKQRRDEFVGNLCGKLLAYALARGLVPSDEPTIEAMRTRLEAEGYRFDVLVESIIASPQFLNKRGRDDPRE